MSGEYKSKQSIFKDFNSQNSVERLWQRIQNKFLIGPTLNEVNTGLLNTAEKFNPKLLGY